ncbi:MAG: helix-turn-helix transcriptional regulator [Chloroflexota bacterium]|nr:helix-turn-helix transcriptional regulator [Chloroflexota bacterium]
MASSVDIQKSLPLTEATYFIMLCLTPKPKHGYAIMKEVQTLSEGRVNLSTGTLYGVLKRLLEQGWIARSEQPEDSENGRERKSYALTDLGRRLLSAEINRLQALVAAADQRPAGALM